MDSHLSSTDIPMNSSYLSKALCKMKPLSDFEYSRIAIIQPYKLKTIYIIQSTITHNTNTIFSKLVIKLWIYRYASHQSVFLMTSLSLNPRLNDKMGIMTSLFLNSYKMLCFFYIFFFLKHILFAILKLTIYVITYIMYIQI